MVFQGNVPVTEITERSVNVRYDVKKALRTSKEQIDQLISDMGNPDQNFIIIDGRKISKSDTITLSLAVNNKMEQLQNQSTTIISVFSEMYKLEKSIGSAG